MFISIPWPRTGPAPAGTLSTGTQENARRFVTPPSLPPEIKVFRLLAERSRTIDGQADWAIDESRENHQLNDGDVLWKTCSLCSSVRNRMDALRGKGPLGTRWKTAHAVHFCVGDCCPRIEPTFGSTCRAVIRRGYLKKITAGDMHLPTGPNLDVGQ